MEVGGLYNGSSSGVEGLGLAGEEDPGLGSRGHGD